MNTMFINPGSDILWAAPVGHFNNASYKRFFEIINGRSKFKEYNLVFGNVYADGRAPLQYVNSNLSINHID